ncbi:unnamed protein product [Vitrella brassicaformis CCMP3155]|uniref:Uncharacterized protein n=2 Tax=Vitrella brassicaformis TaxID=1169539 RepID=A0A0G4EJ15_VITBC|nr:unnamed protein product [Vitrella brassicaformis CCMP3155]|eukprot:CEL95899.1 unnamed protein product [Vitrella brassicaformis CCMP3155]
MLSSPLPPHPSHPDPLHERPWLKYQPGAKRTRDGWVVGAARGQGVIRERQRWETAFRLKRHRELLARKPPHGGHGGGGGRDGGGGGVGLSPSWSEATMLEHRHPAFPPAPSCHYSKGYWDTMSCLSTATGGPCGGTGSCRPDTASGSSSLTPHCSAETSPLSLPIPVRRTLPPSPSIAPSAAASSVCSSTTCGTDTTQAKRKGDHGSSSASAADHGSGSGGSSSAKAEEVSAAAAADAEPGDGGDDGDGVGDDWSPDLQIREVLDCLPKGEVSEYLVWSKCVTPLRGVALREEDLRVVCERLSSEWADGISVQSDQSDGVHTPHTHTHSNTSHKARGNR